MTEIYEFSAPVATLSDLCRLCGEVDKVCTNVFDNASEESLLDKIQIAVRISISLNDQLPKGICNVCLQKLNEFNSFYKQCHDTQERLLEFLSIQSVLHQSDDAQESILVEQNAATHSTNSEEEQDEIYYDVGASSGEEEDVDVRVMVTDDTNQHSRPKKIHLKVNELEKGSMAATLRMEKEPLVQPFSMQSQKLRVNKITNEAASSLSNVQKGPFSKYAGLNCRNLGKEYAVDDCQNRKNHSTKVQALSDDLYTEHSYSRESVQPSNVPREESVPVFLRNVLPIKTASSESQAGISNFKFFPTSPPPLVLISKPKNPQKIFSMNVDKAEVEPLKKCGRVYITNSNKTAAAEVIAKNPQASSSHDDLLSSLICDNAENGASVVLRRGDTETTPLRPEKGTPRNKLKSSHVTTPYLVMADGRLVKLEDVEDEIPFEQIPVPPMVLFHTCKSGENPPSVFLTRSTEEAKPTLSSSLRELCPDLETPSGLLVESYPNGCSLPIFDAPSGDSFQLKKPITNSEMSLMMNLGAPVDTSVGDTKFVVLRTNDVRKTEKTKLKNALMERLKNRVPHCPELVNYLEFMPGRQGQAKCKICDSTYQNARQCEYHIRAKHLSYACVFACDICDKKFATNFLRRRHRFLAHDHTSNFMCSVCGATFRSESVLKKHEMRHNESSELLLCEFCGKGFLKRANYLKHKTDVHLDGKIVCNVCGESFVTNSLLSKHLPIHNDGWCCKVCGEKFVRRNGLKVHMLTHGKSNLPVCDTCGKKCRNLKALYRHKNDFCSIRPD